MASTALLAQQSDVVVDYSKPQTYVIGGVRVTGNQFLDQSRILSIVGFKPGSSITLPSEDVAHKLAALMNQKYFQD